MSLLLYMTMLYLCLAPCVQAYGHVTLDLSEATLDFHSGLYCSIQKVRNVGIISKFEMSKFRSALPIPHQPILQSFNTPINPIYPICQYPSCPIYPLVVTVTHIPTPISQMQHVLATTPVTNASAC